MKRLIFYELLRNVQHKPILMRRIKVFVAIGVIGFFIAAGLLVWAGVSAVESIARVQVEALPKIQVATCLDKTQNLILSGAWLERSPIENLNHLKVACLLEKPKACNEAECKGRTV